MPKQSIRSYDLLKNSDKVRVKEGRASRTEYIESKIVQLAEKYPIWDPVNHKFLPFPGLSWFDPDHIERRKENGIFDHFKYVGGFFDDILSTHADKKNVNVNLLKQEVQNGNNGYINEGDGRRSQKTLQFLGNGSGEQSHIFQYYHFIFIMEPNLVIQEKDMWDRIRLQAFEIFLVKRGMAAASIASHILTLHRYLCRVQGSITSVDKHFTNSDIIELNHCIAMLSQRKKKFKVLQTREQKERLEYQCLKYQSRTIDTEELRFLYWIILDQLTSIAKFNMQKKRKIWTEDDTTSWTYLYMVLLSFTATGQRIEWLTSIEIDHIQFIKTGEDEYLCIIKPANSEKAFRKFSVPLTGVQYQLMRIHIHCVLPQRQKENIPTKSIWIDQKGKAMVSTTISKWINRVCCLFLPTKYITSICFRRKTSTMAMSLTEDSFDYGESMNVEAFQRIIAGIQNHDVNIMNEVYNKSISDNDVIRVADKFNTQVIAANQIEELNEIEESLARVENLAQDQEDDNVINSFPQRVHQIKQMTDKKIRATQQSILSIKNDHHWIVLIARTLYQHFPVGRMNIHSKSNFIPNEESRMFWSHASKPRISSISKDVPSINKKKRKNQFGFYKSKFEKIHNKNKNVKGNISSFFTKIDDTESDSQSQTDQDEQLSSDPESDIIDQFSDSESESDCQLLDQESHVNKADQQLSSDTEEIYEIESVLEWKYSESQQDFLFKIKWKGFQNPTWEYKTSVQSTPFWTKKMERETCQ